MSKGKGYDTMHDLRMKNRSFLAAATVVLLLLCSTNAFAAINASYLYTFSDFNGRVPYTWAGLSSDQERGEIYVINQGTVSIFNSVGMEIYRFGDDRALGIIIDVAVEQDGNILVLSSRRDALGGNAISVLRCNYRGELKETVELKGLPHEFSQLRPNRLVYRNGNIYLADFQSRKIVVMDSSGTFVDGYDVGALLVKEDKPDSKNEMVGFNVDRDGNMLFTVPTLFAAFRMSLDHKVESFGTPGSLDGKFNVVGGIASDDKGFIYVADILKSVVMVYDKDFKFQMQFGHRGDDRGSLVAPQQVEVMHDKIFVNQAKNQGVSVFRINYD
jgi:DNA-binding beta-propeller fold protein YncE